MRRYLAPFISACVIALSSAGLARAGDIIIPDIIITEVIQNPAAVGDNVGEWFEVYNTTASDIDIDGWTIKDDGSDSHVISNGGPLLVPANGFLVLGNNSDTGTNGGAPVDYEYPSDFFLSNGADELVLLDGALTEVARVNWDGGPNFPDPTGASMYLKGPELDQNVGANWDTSTVAWTGSAGDSGSPGAANETGDWGTATDVPPIIAPIGNKDVTLNDALSFDVVAADLADGDEITLSASNLPGGAVFNTVTNVAGVTNTFSWATATPVGVYTSTFYAVDKDGTDSETIEISVNPKSPPVLNPIGNQSATISNLLTFTVTAVPTDGDPVTQLVASNLPGDATFTPSDGANTNGVFTWTEPDPVGVYTTSFYAVDTDGASSETIEISVNVPSAGPSVVVNEFRNDTPDAVEMVVVTDGLDMRGMLLKDYSSSGVNDGGGAFTFSTDALWASVPGGTIIVLRNDASAADTTVGGADYNLDIGLQNATYFNTESGSFNIATEEIIQIKAAGSDRAGSVGAIHTLASAGAGALFDSAPNPKLKAGTGNSATGESVEADNPNGTLGDFDGTDATGDNATGSLGTWNNANNQTFIESLRGPPPADQPPVIAPIGNQAVGDGGTLTFDVVATDSVDGDEITLSASNLPGGAVFNTATNIAGVTNTFTWAGATPVGVYTSTFYAVDKDGADMEEVTITVNPKAPPILNPIGNQSATLNDALQFSVTAVPTDGDPITELSAINLPGDATFTPGDASNTNATFNWASAAPVGVYTTTFFVVDIDGTNSEIVEIDVSEAPSTTLIISEIMQNPSAALDSAGEFFELFNTTASGIDIEGWTIKDDGTDSHVIANGAPLLVPAGDFLVLGNNSDTGSNGGAPVDYQYAGFNLSNGDDEVVLVNPSMVEVARVNYDGGPNFPDPTGASMYLKGPELDQNVGANWDTSTVAWPGSAGDFGSPGDANETGDWGPGATNQPPVIAAIGGKVVTLNDALNFTVTAADDVDEDEITLSVSNLPAGAVFNTVTNIAGVTNDFSWAVAMPIGVYTTTFYAVDKDGADSEEITITVNPKSPPILNPVGNKSVTVSNMLAFTVTASPTDGDPITELVASNLPGDATFTPSDGANTNGTFSWTEATPLGVYTTTFYAVDTDGASSESIEITVEEGASGEALDVSGYRIDQFDSAKTITLPGGTMVEPSGYVVIGRDADQAAFEAFWSVTLGSDVVYINGANAFPSINGAETFQLFDATPASIEGPTGLALSGGNTVQRTNATEDATLATSWEQIADSNATPGSGGVGNGTAGLVINEYSDASGTGNFIYEFVELFYDASGTPPVDQPPVIDAVGDKVVTLNDPLNFTVTATDPVDGDEITLSASNLPGGAVFNTVTNLAGVTNAFAWATATPIGVYTTTFYAVDKDGADMEEITITVNPKSPPILNPIGNQSATVSNLLSFTVTAVPTDGDPITQLVASNLPGDATFTPGDAGNTNGVFTWTEPDPVGVYTTSFYAVDTDGASSETIEITVSEPSAGPSVVVNEFRNDSPDVVELVVVTDGLDMRGMLLKDYSSSGVNDGGGAFTFSTDALWASVPGGTIIVLRNDASAADTTVGGADYNLDIGLQNATYFTAESGSFNIATEEIVQIKGAGSDRAGSVGAIHTMASSGVGAQFDSAPNPKLKASTGNSGGGESVEADNPNGTLGDFDGTDATGDSAAGSLGTWNNANNQTFIEGLRGPPPSDQPPVLSPIGGRAVTLNDALNFTVTATDPVDGDEITLSVSNLPAGAVFNTVTNVAGVTNDFNWANAMPVGVYTTTFYAVDKDGADMEEITITVNPKTPPILNPIGDKAVNLDNPLQFSVTAVPTDGDPITELSAGDLPAGATFLPTDGDNTNGTFNWASSSPVGVYTTTFFVVDIDGTNSETIEISVSEPPPTTIIISEIMQNPAVVADANGEWFEVFNTTAAGIDIEGWTITDAASNNVHTIDNGEPLVVPPREFLVLGANPDPGVNGGAPVDYQYFGITLGNSADQVILLDLSMNEVTRVEYDGGPEFPDPNGASMYLTDSTLDPNVGANWDTSTNVWTGSSGDKGTPGEANDTGDWSAGGDIDSDGDGMPNWWEQLYCGGPTACDPNDDTSDTDGILNVEEYVLDYSPLVTNEMFMMSDIVLGSLDLTFGVTTNSRSYYVEYATNLNAQMSWEWQPLLPGAVPGSNGVVTVTDPSDDPERNYRVWVRVP